jgi:hypothetical protein
MKEGEEKERKNGKRNSWVIFPGASPASLPVLKVAAVRCN